MNSRPNCPKCNSEATTFCYCESEFYCKNEHTYHKCPKCKEVKLFIKDKIGIHNYIPCYSCIGRSQPIKITDKCKTCGLELQNHTELLHTFS